MKNRKIKCPVCGESVFEDLGDYDICNICGWENDIVQRNDPTFWGGANNLSVNESKIVYNLLKHTEKSKLLLEFLDEYKKRDSAIHKKYMNIKLSTIKDGQYTKDFKISHDIFISDINKL